MRLNTILRESPLYLRGESVRYLIDTELLSYEVKEYLSLAKARTIKRGNARDKRIMGSKDDQCKNKKAIDRLINPTVNFFFGFF